MTILPSFTRTVFLSSEENKGGYLEELFWLPLTISTVWTKTMFLQIPSFILHRRKNRNDMWMSK